MKSDIWQFALLATGLACSFAYLLHLPQCGQALLAAPLRIASQEPPLSRVICYITIFGASFTIGPMIFGRLLGADSPRTARSASLAASDIYTCGIVAPVIVMLLRPEKLNQSFFMFAMSGGGICGLAAALSANHLWSFAGLLLSGILAPCASRRIAA